MPVLLSMLIDGIYVVYGVIPSQPPLRAGNPKQPAGGGLSGDGLW